MTLTARKGSSPGLRLGSLAGIPIYLGTSWFILAAVIVLVTGSNLSLLGGQGYAVGLAFAISLLLSVLLHEIAHALVARWRGLEVQAIHATLMGGHTAIEPSGRSPGTTALVAAAGPLANLALAGIAYPLHTALVGSSQVPLTILAWGVLWANLFLAGFNLLPGMPLDGGRVVMAAVWRLTGEAHQGWTVAGWLGRLVTVGVLAWFLSTPLRTGASLDTWDIAWLVLLVPTLWRGASAALAWGGWLRSVESRTFDQLAERVTVLAAQSPLREAMAHQGVVLAADAHGRTTLFLDSPGLGGGADLELPLSARLARLPDENLLELTGDGALDLLRVAQLLSADPGRPVIGTRQGQPVGAVTAGRLAEVFGNWPGN